MIAVAVKGLLIIRRESFVECALMRLAVSWARSRALTLLVFSMFGSTGPEFCSCATKVDIVETVDLRIARSCSAFV